MMGGGMMRSVLYVPANREGAVAKARTLAADAVILDLEDAVQPEAKADARALAVLAAASGDWGARARMIRVNGLSSEWAAADFVAVSAARLDAIVVPKVESAEEAARAASLAGGTPIWAMIETPKGVLAAATIAAVPGVSALMAGLADLGVELRAQADAQRSAFLYALGAIVMAARAAGVLAIDGVYTDVRDAAGFLAEARQGRMLGFDTKSLIHPSQIEPCNAVFSPSDAERADAKGLIAAYEAALAQGRGVATYQGKLVEVLHVAAARRVLGLV
jgi:citrate lyase beta subunit